MKTTKAKFLAPLLLATALLALAACSDNTGTAVTTTTTTPTAGVISLGTSANFILTDNATAATLTATLVDSSNAVMAGVVVSFSATTGNLSAATATTDANGQAILTLKSGLSDLTNRTATVTASVAGQSASIPILIKGSTLALTLSPSNSIQVGTGTITATATAADAAGLGKPNQTIRFSVGATSTGAATLSATTLTTDATGVATPLTFTPTAAGTVVLTAEWLNTAGAVTVTATQNIIVTAASGVAFAITTPTANPLALSTAATQAIAVTVPTLIGAITVANVRISATAGTLTGANPVTGPLTSILQAPAANAVAATYTAPGYSGSVTVQVDALDGAGVSLSSLSRTFVVSAPATAAAKLLLSASVSTIVPSSGINISTATLKVIVRDVGNNAVGGAAVLVGLVGTTGSGESVSPAVIYTDSQGEATTTFSAGASPTLAAIYAQASLVGETCAFTPPTTETNPKCDETQLIVASTAVSVTVGFGTTVEDTANATQYKLPGSVLVVNSNGSPVAGVPVTLTVFPIEYRNGHIYSTDVVNTATNSLVINDFDCEGPFSSRPAVQLTFWPVITTFDYTDFTAAEDVNRNGILEPGEDAGLDPLGGVVPLTQSQLDAQVDIINGRGLLSPPQAAGGTVPLTVTTDEFGAATFYLQYPKSSAWFIKDEVSARVIVSGTESTAKMNIELPMSEPDKKSNICSLTRQGSY